MFRLKNKNIVGKVGRTSLYRKLKTAVFRPASQSALRLQPYYFQICTKHAKRKNKKADLVWLLFFFFFKYWHSMKLSTGEK